MGVTRKSRPNVKVLRFLYTAPSKAWALRAYPGTQEPGQSYARERGYGLLFGCG